MRLDTWAIAGPGFQSYSTSIRAMTRVPRALRIHGFPGGEPSAPGGPYGDSGPQQRAPDRVTCYDSGLDLHSRPLT